MSKKKTYKVGDKIVDYGQVFRIFKIKKQKNDTGELERVIYFRPFYQGAKNSGVVCSIPLKNLELAEIRDPLSVKEIKLLFVKLKKRKRNIEYSDIGETKELFKRYDPESDIMLIRTLWKEQQDKSESFSKNKRDIFHSVVERFSQEFALVNGLSLEKAKEKVYLALQG